MNARDLLVVRNHPVHDPKESPLNNLKIDTASRFPDDKGWRGLQDFAVMASKPCKLRDALRCEPSLRSSPESTTCSATSC
jgi:hypothetical protein